MPRMDESDGDDGHEGHDGDDGDDGDGNDDYFKKETQTHNNRDIIQTQSNHIFVDVQHNWLLLLQTLRRGPKPIEEASPAQLIT